MLLVRHQQTPCHGPVHYRRAMDESSNQRATAIAGNKSPHSRGRCQRNSCRAPAGERPPSGPSPAADAKPLPSSAAAMSSALGSKGEAMSPGTGCGAWGRQDVSEGRACALRRPAGPAAPARASVRLFGFVKAEAILLPICAGGPAGSGRSPFGICRAEIKANSARGCSTNLAISASSPSWLAARCADPAMSASRAARSLTAAVRGVPASPPPPRVDKSSPAAGRTAMARQFFLIQCVRMSSLRT